MPASEVSDLRRLLIIYSSQTGQAKAIAEDVAEKAPEHGFTADVHCISQTEKTFWLERETHAVIITSTTGDGEAPETAGKFWRRLKKKTLPSDHLQKLRFSLLGLGDTNYSNFCNCGKMFRTRLLELGATPFTDPAWADDGTGLEIVVEPWVENLWTSLEAEFNIGKRKPTNECISNGAPVTDVGHSKQDQNGKDHNERDQKQPQIINGVINDQAITNIDTDSLTANKTLENDLQQISDNKETLSTGTTAKSSMSVDSKEVGPDASLGDKLDADDTPDGSSSSQIAETLTTSVPPLSESGLTLPALPASYLRISFEHDLPLENSHPELQNGCPFPSASSDVVIATVTSSKQLTREDAVKKTLLVTLDIGECGWNWSPGDSIGVLAPNTETEVNDLLQRLELSAEAHVPYKLEVISGTKKRNAAIPPHIPSVSTLYDVLRYSCDIRSAPKKALLRALVEHTSDPGEKRRLQELCSRQGGETYSRYVREAGVGIMDILIAFPSSTPPVTTLLEHLPRLQPRPYSAASSNLVCSNKLDIVFNVVEIPCGNGRHSNRRGVCTGYLDNITSGTQQKINPVQTLDESVRQMSVDDHPKVGVYLRSNQFFRPCEDLSRPIIMVGPGTGVAPFIGFLQHREEQMKSLCDSKNIGESWLFFGCRHRDRDFIFRREMEHYVTSCVLKHLHVCHSRDDVEDDVPRYVQDVIISQGTDVAAAICERDAMIYVCGDAKGMARDVTQALRTIIQEYKGFNESEVDVYIKEMRTSRRYLEDVWS